MHTQTRPVISIVAALQRADRGIGNKRGLLWHIPEDLRRFKEITMGKPILMGRKTFESIGRPLPGRRNIVITRRPGYAPEGCEAFGSLDDAIRAAAEAAEICVIGGGEIYAQALPKADVLHLTLIDGAKSADSFFPVYDEFSIQTIVGEGVHEDVRYVFAEFRRP